MPEPPARRATESGESTRYRESPAGSHRTQRENHASATRWAWPESEGCSRRMKTVQDALSQPELLSVEQHACSRSGHPAAASNPGSSRSRQLASLLRWPLALALSLVMPCLAMAADWTRVNASTLVMKGHIERAEFARFSAQFDNRVRRLVVTSEGGVEFQALQIAEVLAQRGVDVYVLGYCLSACANFIFAGGRQRLLIGDAVVGYHGSEISELLDEERFRTSLAKRLPPDGAAWKLAWVRRLGERAQALYQRQDASTKILHLSGCVVSHAGENWEKFKGDEDTGGTEVRSGSTIRMWIPSRAQLASHGIAVQPADPKAVAALGLAASTLKAGTARIDLSGAVRGEAGVPAACRG